MRLAITLPAALLVFGGSSAHALSYKIDYTMSGLPTYVMTPFGQAQPG